ncbi:MAG TPA: transglycosylase SLT domain-containing protein [Solimonas sp.]|nr:transglycosylase SLT domain-containing protein [Solimonas sp.]
MGNDGPILGLRAAVTCAIWAAAAFAPAAFALESDELIWPRIASGMRIVDPEHPETVTWARRYARQPLQLAQMLARSEPFLWHIVEAVELREMPLELALLPAVESGFNAHARSSQEARGLWQFVPWTGRAFGLASTATYDGRRDPVASTHAALGYLQKLYYRFDNDWLLAVAAYNLGQARLSGAMQRQATRKFWDLAELPEETREHVPRLLGLALLVKQPQRFGVHLPPLRNRHAAELVQLDGPRDVAAAARAARVDLETVERYNPGLLNVSNSRGRQALLLPREAAARMRSELALRAYKPKPEARRVEHVVRSGDSLWTIARRYRVSVRQISDWNDLNSRSVLRPGRKLTLMPQAS